MEALRLQVSFPQVKLLLPVGISFYTLETIGYLSDIYWGKITAEKHLGRLALFLCFFPKLMEGPICNYREVSGKLWKCESLKQKNLSDGAVRILWGLLKKMVVADRLNVVVAHVFGHYADYNGLTTAAAAVAYTVQLYMEFSGCMDIILGSGMLFGIRFPENFQRPFFSRTASEFWRRWHITLGIWFRTYIFYPVSASGIVKKWNRSGKKCIGKYLTNLVTSCIVLFPVWIGNGIWHGPRWTYIFYGLYYFIILFLGIAVQPVRDAFVELFHIRDDSFWWRGIQLIKTWLIILVGELFFRAEDMGAGFHMLCSIFRDFHISQLWDGTMLSLGLTRADYAAVFGGCLLVFAVELLLEKHINVMQKIAECRTPLRWGIYYGLIFAVVIFGAYGAGYQAVDMIYAGF